MIWIKAGSPGSATLRRREYTRSLTMAYSDMLLHIDSYPNPTTPEAIDDAVAIASSLGGGLSALAVEIVIPLHSNRIADRLVGLSAIAREEEDKSRLACGEGLAHFTAKATEAGIFRETALGRTHLYDVGDYVAARARTRDLTLLPLIGGLDGQREVAQSVIFASGRPALFFRAGAAAALAEPGLVVLAWDGGPAAARAMADAMPILERARQVRVLTVLNDKPSAVKGHGVDVLRHLQVHGVDAVVDEVDADGKGIGAVLEAYVSDHRPALLVMGAYGHSRFREFLLGGATEHVLADPPCPVFFSH
jgi:nucleotide-binding universal stress UspA family protein